METQGPMSISAEFEPGSSVIYAQLGRCSVLAIESRELDGRSIRFYKLERQKSTLSRSTRQEPAIWVPVESARGKGLRAPMTRDETEAVFSILGNREYYFSLNDPWSAILPQLETVIRLEGGVGLAKVFGYLHVLRKRYLVPPTEITRTYEAVQKQLFRELTEVLGLQPRSIEERATKALKQKLLPDS